MRLLQTAFAASLVCATAAIDRSDVIGYEPIDVETNTWQATSYGKETLRAPAMTLRLGLEGVDDPNEILPGDPAARIVIRGAPKKAPVALVIGTQRVSYSLKPFVDGTLLVDPSAYTITGQSDETGRWDMKIEFGRADLAGSTYFFQGAALDFENFENPVRLSDGLEVQIREDAAHSDC